MILFPDARPHRPRDFAFKVARTPDEQAGFWRLRREVFVEEQEVFLHSDIDGIDRGMLPLICVSLVMGMPDEVVGVVRIDERSPGIWWGSRLAVDPRFRSRLRFGPSVAVRNRQPHGPVRWSVGAGLIHKAVSTAVALGCDEFHAHVQEQNVRFFEKLHWKAHEAVDLHGRAHRRVQAELAHYPPLALRPPLGLRAG
jgi:hypothetical protein